MVKPKDPGPQPQGLKDCGLPGHRTRGAWGLTCWEALSPSHKGETRPKPLRCRANHTGTAVPRQTAPGTWGTPAIRGSA